MGMYIAKETRYDKMRYNRCGKSGLKLPELSLGLWHNFGSNGNFDIMTEPAAAGKSGRRHRRGGRISSGT